MTPDTMTLDECRDWLARQDGWTPTIVAPWDCPGWGRGNWRTVDHPYPPTLDGAEGAMPKGWFFFINYCSLADASGHWSDWYCCGAVKRFRNGDGRDEAEARAPTEILARYRLAVACRMAQKEQA